MLLAPQLARFSLRFSNFEYFWLAIFGLSMSAVVSTGATHRGLLAAAFGMLISTVGIDVVGDSLGDTVGSDTVGLFVGDIVGDADGEHVTLQHEP